MIDLGLPAALLGLAALPLIYLIHRHRDSGRPLRVAALFLWPAADAAVGQPRRRRRQDPAWRRRALLAALLAMAAAGPRWWTPAAPFPLVWFDTGPTMGTLERGGSRRALAVQRLVAALTGDAAAGAEIRDLRGARAPLTLEGTPRDWPAALEAWLARATQEGAPPVPPLPGDRQAPQWLVTDGASPATIQWAGGIPLTRVITVGRATGNAGIEGLGARVAAAGDGLQAIARLRNPGPEALRRTLEVSWPGGQLTLPATTLEADTVGELAFPLPATAVSGRVTARLLPADSLVADDRLALDIPATPLVLGGDCPRGLADLARLVPGWTRDPGPGGVAVHCGAVEKASAGAALHVVTGGPVMPITEPLVWSPAAGSLRELILEPASVARRTPDPPPGEWLLAAGPRPLITVAGPADAPHIHLALDLERLHGRDPEGFALLLTGLLERLAPGGAAAGLWWREAAAPVAAIAPRTIEPAGVVPAAAARPGATPLDRLLMAAALLVLLVDALRCRRRVAALAPRGALGLVLAVAWWLPPGDAGAPADLLLLMDDSASVDSATVDGAWRELARGLARLPKHVQWGLLRFAGEVSEERPLQGPAAGREALPGTPRMLRSRAIFGGATDLERALAEAAARRRAGHATHLLLVSDGRETTGDAMPLLRALHGAGVTLWELPMAPAAQPPRHAFHVPARVARGAAVPTTLVAPRADALHGVLIDGEPAVPFAVPGDGAAARAWLGGLAPGRHPVTARVGGQEVTEILNVVGPARIGHVTATPGPTPLGTVLEGQGLAVVTATAQELEALLGIPDLGLVILEDVPVDAAGDAAWRLLERRVEAEGMGLLVLGGPASFAAGGYRGSRLERLLPLLSEAPPGRGPVAVQFLVDSSGSMAAQPGGEDPLGTARAAVLATARGLASPDRVGLHVFDSAGRRVLPLGPRATALEELTTAWSPRSGGGTRLAGAFAAAVADLAADPAERRLLVLISDGRLSDGPTAPSMEALEKARGELVVVAVDGDPEGRLAALARAAGAPFLEVEHRAHLPRLVAGAVDGLLVPPRPGPVMARVDADGGLLARHAPLPPWDGVAVTRARPGATVSATAADGLPLVAHWRAGLGRVMALPGGLHTWASAWPAWPRWPALTRDLVDYTAAGAAAGGIHVRVHSRPRGYELEAEALTADGEWAVAPLVVSLRDPAGRERRRLVRALAPGFYTTPLETPVPGPYGLELVLGEGRLVHHFQVGTPAAETTGGGRDILPAARAEGLVRPWTGVEALAGTGGPSRRGLLLLALAGLMVLLVVERRSGV